MLFPPLLLPFSLPPMPIRPPCCCDEPPAATPPTVPSVPKVLPAPARKSVHRWSFLSSMRTPHCRPLSSWPQRLIEPVTCAEAMCDVASKAARQSAHRREAMAAPALLCRMSVLLPSMASNQAGISGDGCDQSVRASD